MGKFLHVKSPWLLSGGAVIAVGLATVVALRQLGRVAESINRESAASARAAKERGRSLESLPRELAGSLNEAAAEARAPIPGRPDNPPATVSKKKKKSETAKQPAPPAKTTAPSRGPSKSDLTESELLAILAPQDDSCSPKKPEPCAEETAKKEWSGGGGPEQAGTLIAKNETEWKILWGKVSSEPPPVVDFSKEMAVVIFGGKTREFSLEIAGIGEEPGKIVVRYRRWPGLPKGGHPYIIRLAPKSDLPVEFKITDR
ncbi:MAG: hypothetical protein HYT79_01750 [Elusimicrobia bacterium]|nr:hypothetical protein [Elusimicrobiota bacterium]